MTNEPHEIYLVYYAFEMDSCHGIETDIWAVDTAVERPEYWDYVYTEPYWSFWEKNQNLGAISGFRNLYCLISELSRIFSTAGAVGVCLYQMITSEFSFRKYNDDILRWDILHFDFKND